MSSNVIEFRRRRSVELEEFSQDYMKAVFRTRELGIDLPRDMLFAEHLELIRRLWRLGAKAGLRHDMPPYIRTYLCARFNVERIADLPHHELEKAAMAAESLYSKTVAHLAEGSFDHLPAIRLGLREVGELMGAAGQKLVDARLCAEEGVASKDDMSADAARRTSERLGLVIGEIREYRSARDGLLNAFNAALASGGSVGAWQTELRPSVRPGRKSGWRKQIQRAHGVIAEFKS